MKCAYCGKETKGTKEHIISSAILDLFPECYLTYDGLRKKVYKSDPIVMQKKLLANILLKNILIKTLLKLNIIIL